MKLFVSILKKLVPSIVMTLLFFYGPGISYAGTEKNLPPGPGRDVVINTCTVCHSDSIIRANRMSRDGWDRTITWMQKQQGLWELDGPTRTVILDYLELHFGQNGSGNKKQPARNPMYKHSYHPNPL